MVQESFEVPNRHRGHCAVQARLDFVALLLEPAADRDRCLKLRPEAPTTKAVAVTEGCLGIAAQLVRPGIEPSLAELLDDLLPVVPRAQGMERGIVCPDLADGVVDLWVGIRKDGVRLAGKASEEVDPARFVIVGHRPDVADPHVALWTTSGRGKNPEPKLSVRKGMPWLLGMVGRISSAGVEGLGVHRNHT